MVGNKDVGDLMLAVDDIEPCRVVHGFGSSGWYAWRRESVEAWSRRPGRSRGEVWWDDGMSRAQERELDGPSFSLPGTVPEKPTHKGTVLILLVFGC